MRGPALVTRNEYIVDVCVNLVPDRHRPRKAPWIQRGYTGDSEVAGETRRDGR